MNKPILLLSLTAATILTAQPKAQAQENTAYAITGATKGDHNWTVVRQIDLSNGSLVRNIYVPLSQKVPHVNAATGKEISISNAAVVNQQAVSNCNCSPLLSAASAYDARQNRLYFINLFGNELQYIDLNQRVLKIYHIQNQPVKKFAAQLGEADNITRMTFGSEGNGYALTNNGNRLIRFTTGRSVTISDLGALIDGQRNGKMSVHAQTESWGGDMVADDGGHLYLFTIAGHVFKIDPSTMIADFLGTISGLPESYSVNAAAVDMDGNVVVSSSLDAGNYYRVDLSTFNATAIDQKADDEVFNASDFANDNLIACGDKKIEAPVAVKEEVSKMIAIYPNPVTDKTVHVYFNNLVQGKAMIQVAELGGKRIANTAVTVTSKGQYQTVRLPASAAPGMYVVRVMNADKTVFSESVLVK